MREVALHIIASDVPFPPNYGGAVEMFYKIKFLHEAGVKIYLHCYEYGRGPQVVLNDYCETVEYYPRKTGLAGISLRLPYMMYSRRSDALLRNLKRIDAPILFEGVHTAYYLNHPDLAGRLKLMRNHNLEQVYYALLGKREKNWWKKIYYFLESRLLKRAEARLFGADVFLTLARHDFEFFQKKYPDKQHGYLPGFQPYTSVMSQTGKGDFILYHGNLAHSENEEAALFLIQKVVPQLKHRVIIAGRNPTEAIQQAAAQWEQVQLIANPNSLAMEDLIVNAQVHVVPTFQATGLKLKLLHALFSGRHVIVNHEMLTGTGLDEICTEVSSAEEWITRIHQLMETAFTELDKAQRQRILASDYDCQKNAQRIKSFLKGSHHE